MAAMLQQDSNDDTEDISPFNAEEKTTEQTKNASQNRGLKTIDQKKKKKNQTPNSIIFLFALLSPCSYNPSSLWIAQQQFCCLDGDISLVAM